MSCVYFLSQASNSERFVCPQQAKKDATKCESQPNAVYVWDTTTLQLHTVLLHQNMVKNFKFAPHAHQLLIGTGQSRVFLWTPNGSCVVSLPQERATASGLNVQRLLWSPRGTNILLTDRNNAILAFPSAELLQGAVEVKPMHSKVTSPRGSAAASKLLM